MSMDHGPLSGIRKRNTPRQERQHAAGIERTIDNALAETKAQEEAERKQWRVQWEKRNGAVPYTPEELAAATHVRTTTGWFEVLRVNKNSVTVFNGFSAYRYPLAHILEVRTIGEKP